MIKRLIHEIRDLVHDEQHTGYDDIDILVVINAGIRFIVRTILSNKPELLMAKPIEGTLAAGQNIICLDQKMLSILDVRVKDHSLIPASPTSIRNLNRQSDYPYAYCLCGFKTIMIYPKPKTDMEYIIFYVQEIEEIKPHYEDKSKYELPFPNIFYDALLEYALIRLQMTNEFDMSQEMTVMQAVAAQVEDIIKKYPAPRHHINSYYCNHHGVRGYN